jgi:biopolymer transport protein ExbD
MRSVLVLISVLAFLVIVGLLATHLFDHFSEQKDEMIKSLPKPPPDAGNSEVIVRIDTEGSISLGTDPVTESQLADHLAQLAMPLGSRRVILKLDKNAPQSAISQVLDACAKAGISNVSRTSLPSAGAP